MTSSKTVMINLMVDTTKNMVVFADCGGDFVDIVLSYLTLPMSSIFRLIGKDDIPAAGSIGNIYGSFLKLENHNFRNEACKSLILHPLDATVSKLHSSLAICLDQNPTETRSLFYCGNCMSSKTTVCLYSGAKCVCRGIMDRWVSSRIQNGIKGAVFVQENFRYIITDDFMITKTTTDSVVSMMQNFSIRDRSRIEKREVHVELSHVLRLLKCCLVSTDMLLSNTFLDNKETIISRTQAAEETSTSQVPGMQAVEGNSSLPTDHTIKLKLFVNKIDKNLIHAETNEEFVDFLFSILCIPVGCILMLSNGQINFGCFQNIHNSVTSLSLADCVKNNEMVSMLASPKSPPFSTIKIGQQMKLVETNPEILHACYRFPNCSYDNRIELDMSISTNCKSNSHCLTSVSLHDPKQYPASKSTTGFLNESGYVISDHLNINPLSAISVASNLLNTAVDDEVELITVDVGPQQALALLRASVTSRTPLTDVFLRNREGFKDHSKFTMTSSRSVMINLMVDTTRNRVVFADCGGDFVDIVLSYLTLPLSSIFRLIGKDDIPAAGSIGNIYGSFLSLENQYFRNEACKSLILHPLDAGVSKLHSSLAICLDQNPSETRSLFYCGNCMSSNKRVCLYSGAKCVCGGIMDRCVSSRIQNGIKGAVFVQENFRYIITDDFMINKATTDSVIAMMQKFSNIDRSRIEKREVHVELSHVLRLLKCCLVSSDMLLSNTFLDTKETIMSRTQPPEETSTSQVPGSKAIEGNSSSPTDHTIKLKLFVNQIEKKLIHAETNEKFVDFLFSILCIPVGCIAMLSNGQIKFGCFQNIHNSVTSLSAEDCIPNKDMVSLLASPKSPPFSTLKNEKLMKLVETNPEILHTCNGFPSCGWITRIEIDKSLCSYCINSGHYPSPVSLHDPKQYPASESTTGFLNESGYVISDDLNIKQLSGISVASNLLNAAVEGELELITVEVGPQQALALVIASVTSKTPLTDVFLRYREGFKQHRRKETY